MPLLLQMRKTAHFKPNIRQLVNANSVNSMMASYSCRRRSRHILVVALLITLWSGKFGSATEELPSPTAASSPGQTNEGEKEAPRSTRHTNRLRAPRDEFNSTESIRFNIIHDDESNLAPNKQQLSSLKNLLLRSSPQDCCPKWKNLTQNGEIVDELKRKFGKHKAPASLRGSDLLGELSITFANITYLSIDGQPGDNERDKYYSFYDNVQYFLRLIQVARNFLADREIVRQPILNEQQAAATGLHEIDFTRRFQRQLKSLEFKANQDPILATFMQELKQTPTGNNESQHYNQNFDYYEDFLARTQFGQYYAKNISMIRESVMVFDQICSHLMHIDLLGNLTRPSKQYELIRRMSFELYQIRNELIEQISIRVLSNRHDVQRIFARLNDFTETRPYIRMLGDEFSSSPPNYRDYVRQLTQLLDLYLRNNMTQASFYNSLSELPEDFILLGSSIAQYYETKEAPNFSKFDAEYFNQSLNVQQNSSDNGNQSMSNQKPTDARRSNLSLLTRLFN